MIKLKNLCLGLDKLSADRASVAVLVCILPLLTLMGFGLGLAIKYGHLLMLSMVICLTIVGVAVSIGIAKIIADRHKRSGSLANSSPHPSSTSQPDEVSLVSPPLDWSTRELEFWEQAKRYSRDLLAQEVEWENIHQPALRVFELVAKQYHKQPLNFSVCEGLKLIEEISRRYRKLLQEHIPVAEQLKVSHLKAGYQYYEKYEKYEKVIPLLFKSVRALRYATNLVVNPGKIVSDFISQQFSSNMTQGVIDSIQLKAKEALLDEVAMVAINLYSQRFSIDQQNVPASATLETDLVHLAAPLEPIRIAIVGQVGAGKSSLTNLLNGEFAVEVGVLATTEGITVCEAQFDEAAVKIIDLPGLDGDAVIEQLIFDEFLKSDLVLWLVKANQPARELDTKFRQKIKHYYAQANNVSRKEPTIICIVNQVDMLNPVQDWQPPYDLADTGNPKAKIISQALAYNKALLTPDEILPLSIAEHKPHLGVEELMLLLNEQLLGAYNVQLNRKRKAAIHKGVKIRDQARRVGKSTKALAQGAFNHLKAKYTKPSQ